MRKKLLASILTVCMLFTMLPTAAFAADEDIAENAVLSDANVEATTAPESGDVQEEEAAENTAPVTLYVDSKAEYTDETAPERAEGATYKTLKDAVEKVEKGDTIKLQENASGCGIVVPEGSDFTLDFAGFSYTVDKGSLAGSSGTESQCFQLLKNSTLTFKDGTIKANHSGVAMLIQNYANLTLDRMTLDGNTMTRTGATYTMSNNNGTVVIEDSIIIAQGGNEDVAFDVCGFGDYAGANVTVKGDSKITGDIELSDNGKEHSDGLSLAIESGTVDGTFKTAAGADKVQTTVKGGTFSDIAGAVKYAKDGATLKLLKDVTLTSTIIMEDSKKLTLDLNEHTITGNDCRVFHVKSGTLDLTGKGTVTSVKPDGGKLADTSSVIRVGDNNVEAAAGLVIGKDVTIKAPNTYGVGAFGKNAGKTITVAGKIHAGPNAALGGNGTDGLGDTVFTVEPTAELISKESAAIYHPQTGTLTIEGGTITGVTGIEMRAGTLNVKGGTISGGTGTATINPEGNTNGTTSANIGIAVVQHTTKKPIQVNITGGTVSGGAAVYESNPQENGETGRGEVSVEIRDVTLTGDVKAEGFGSVSLNEVTVTGDVTKGEGSTGSMAIVDSTITGNATGTDVTIVNSTVNGTLTNTTPEGAVALVGGKTYDTLKAAIDNVQAGETIYILKDIPNAEGISVPSDKNFTIDFGGYTYTLTRPGAGSTNTETNGFQLLKDSTITFKNGTIRISEQNLSAGAGKPIMRIIQNYANLTLEDMHIYAKNQAGGENYPLSFNNGNITFKGDTDIVTSSNQNAAFDVCKYSNYPSAKVTFDESYTGTINGKIVYDSTNATTHKLTIQGNGTFGTIEATQGAADAAKDGIEVTSGHFAKPVNEDYLADSVKAQLESASNPEAPYSYYPSLEAAQNAAKPGDVVSPVGNGASTTTYTVTLDYNDGKTADKIYTEVENSLIILPAPTRSGYTFDGWYNGSTKVSNPYTVTGNVTLVAQWSYIDNGDSYEPSGDYLVSVDKTTGGKVTVNPGRADKGYELDELTVTAKNGDTVKLTEKSNGKFTFKMPDSKVTVEAVFVKEDSEKPVVTLPFADVNKGDWFYDAVEYVYGNDLMNGTSATAFSPYLTTSRAMMLTMLARYDGVDTTTGSTWYEAGAVWAVSKGISDGTNLEADLTREQLVTMLWRYTGSPVVESDLSAYPDGGAVSDWAVNAMIWATQTGVITGNGAGALAPQGTATRAEVATILARFCAMER